MFRSLILVAGALALAGCAAGSRCLSEQPYANAKSVPPLQPVEGLKLPESSAALKIPPAPAEPVPFGQKVKDAKGDEVVQCLDKPPPMPAPVEPKPAEAKPAEKAPG